jgi:hypothetical protein
MPGTYMHFEDVAPDPLSRGFAYSFSFSIQIFLDCLNSLPLWFLQNSEFKLCHEARWMCAYDLSSCQFLLQPWDAHQVKRQGSKTLEERTLPWSSGVWLSLGFAFTIWEPCMKNWTSLRFTFHCKRERPFPLHTSDPCGFCLTDLTTFHKHLFQGCYLC